QNDAPTVSAPESSSASLGSGSYSINLLLLASDVDGDVLTVSDMSYTVDGVPTGNGGVDLPSGVTVSGSTLSVDPTNAAYGGVDYGGSVTIVASYTIRDGSGGAVAQSETITLNRTTDFPIVTQAESTTVTEGDIVTEVNLLLHSSDPEDNDLSVGDVIYTVNGVATGNGGTDLPSGVTRTDSMLTLDPGNAAFDYLSAGEQAVILVNYRVIDDAGGSVEQTETITINGTNDIPVVSASGSSITTEGDASYSLNLLLHASDPDSSDTLSVGSVSYAVNGIPTGNGAADLPSGITRSGNMLTVDPDNGWFSHLAVGESATIVANYIISDGSGRSVPQSAMVMINGSNDRDVELPTVIAFSPTDGAVGVAIDNDIILTFSEPVLRGTGVISIHSDSSDGMVVESYNAETSSNLMISGSTLTIDPSASLAYGRHYYVTFADGSIADYAGNHFAESNSYGFTTGADPYAGRDDDNDSPELFLAGVGVIGLVVWLVF
ncbi:MAG: hypothetical protein HGB23_08310, partial [Chlorobiaceae bacterium]|nr:hypothetical protein [Chlorobiaceae bacterium]